MLLRSTNIIVSVLLGLVAVGLAFVALPWFGNKALIVRSGSMEPAIRVGDLIVVNAKDEGLLSPLPLVSHKYKEGDIVAFTGGKNGKVLTSHRIVGTEIKDGKVFYKTKGDANNAADNGFVAEDSVVGKAIFIVPYAGKLFAFTKSNVGFPLLVIFPALLVIILEAISLFKELRRQLRKAWPYEARVRSNTLAILIPLVVGGFIIQNSHAFFSDTETSTNNTFTAAESFPHLVINEVSSDGGPNEEWVELFNPTSSSINVSGWKIEDALTDDVFPTVDPIPSGGYAVVKGNASTVSVPASAITITLGNSTIGSGLNNPGDLVRLRTPSGVIVDEMSYGSNSTVFASPPDEPDEEESLARSPNGVDTDTATDWVIDSSPSIGVAN